MGRKVSTKHNRGNNSPNQIKRNLSRDSKYTSKSFKYTDTSGKEKFITEAIKDEATGEMVSMVYLDEIVVSAVCRLVTRTL